MSDEEGAALSDGLAQMRIEQQGAAVERNGKTPRHDAEARTDVSASSRSSSARARSTAGSAAVEGGQFSTKVYYHIDDEPTPYCTEVRHALSERVTLADFKRVLNRSNFKFYCKAIDQEVGGEVKAEIRDDSQPLHRSSNGQYELFLLTAEGSSHSEGAASASTLSKAPPPRHHVAQPAPAPSAAMHSRGQQAAMFGHPSMLPARHNQRYVGAKYFEQPGHHRRAFPGAEDSTIYTAEESDARMFSDDESRLSTSTDNITSVSRQHHHGGANNLYRRRNRRQYHRPPRGLPSRASSLSSMTETSMALEVITVTLNMDTVNFLGISIVGQSCSRGDNGIYVANVMPGGAVALDGRIEPGDMILQVNEISFENFTNDQAVEVLKEAVNKRGPIKLTVAKSFDGGHSNFMVPAREPVRPIDTHAWVQHTNAVRGIAIAASVNSGAAMNAIPEGSEGAPTPIPGQYAQQHPMGNYLPHHHQHQQQQQQQRPATGSSTTATTSNGSGGGGAPNNATMTTIVGPGGVVISVPKRLDAHKTDRRALVQAMAMPNSGLDIRNRTWLKIPIGMAFLGSALVDWLLEHVDGLRERKDAKRYASELLKEQLIAHVVNKVTFTEQCYYVLGEECADLMRLRVAAADDEGDPPHGQFTHPHGHFIQQQRFSAYPGGAAANVGPQQGYRMQQQQQHNASMNNGGGGGWSMQQHSHARLHHQQQAHSMISEYASMPPISPYPMPPSVAAAQQRADAANAKDGSDGAGEGGSSGGGSDHRRKAVLPPAPASSVKFSAHGPLPAQQMAAGGGGRNAFRVAGGAPNFPVEEFFVDHL